MNEPAARVPGADLGDETQPPPSRRQSRSVEGALRKPAGRPLTERARGAALSASQQPRRAQASSGFAAREAHGRGPGAIVCLYVDQRAHSLVYLLLCPLQGRPDVLRFLDIFAVGAEALRHDVVTRVAEIAAGLVALRIGGPAAIEADHDEQRQLVPDRGIELHRVLPERAIAVQANDRRVRLRDLGTDCERHPHAHCPERTRIKAMARHEGRDRLAAEIEDLLAVNTEDRVALLEILDLFAKPQRVDVAIGRVVATGARALLRFAVGELLAPLRETIGGRCRERVEQLL